ncbi:unnamed protein product [Nezara viridula]|uniref:CCHC-type domain-containing protein n=1 Tax=Nezara viridula TaxID=85310 RepID=A0A9P0MU72_NEZVI|nr:unnamed protein product [Nezara viridula]
MISTITHLSVASVQQYGAFIKLAGNKNQGLVHRTQISNSNVDDASDVLQKGDRDDGKISLSMKVVDQGDGKDLDPNGVQIHQDEQKRREKPNSSGRKKIELEAVFNTTCSKCGVHGHIAKDCFKDPTGKVYELLPDEDVPDNSQDPETVSRDIKELKRKKKELKKKHKKNKKKRHHSSSDSLHLSRVFSACSASFRRRCEVVLQVVPIMANFSTTPGCFRNEQHFKTVVLWLEDQVIRHYKIEDRESLRDLDSPNWNNAFVQYCKDLECPLPVASPNECLEWIAGLAVRLEYSDNKEKYKNQTSEILKNQKNTTPVVKSSNPLDNLDFQSLEFKNGVEELAKLLKVTQHPDHLVTLEAICNLITQSLDKNTVNETKPQGVPYPIMEMDLGFDLGDYVLNRAAKILRLLYIHDLRNLQTKINEAIVAVQSVTANPKTDTKLGKVGY